MEARPDRPANPDVPARLLRDRVRDQSLDEPSQVGSDPSRVAPAVAGAARDAASSWASTVELIEPVAGPARPGLHGQRRAGLSRTCSSARGSATASARARRPHFERWAADARLRGRARCPRAMNFEGAGDALFCGETLFAGYRFRSDVRSHQWVGERLGRRGPAAGAGRPAVLPPRHLLLPARPEARRSTTPAPSTTTAARCCATGSPT